MTRKRNRKRREIEGESSLARWEAAEVDFQLGRHVRARTRVRLSPAGIGAIAGLVSGILLSTAVVVHVARREPGPLRLRNSAG